MPTMNPHLYRSLFWMTGIGAFALAAASHAMQIDGLSPFEPVSVNGVTPVVDDATMQIGLPGARMLTITPWPAFLPRRFGQQSVTGTRQIHPAGPIDQLSFSRAAEASPWLTIGSGARRSTRLVGHWQLQRSGQRWLLSDGKTKKRLESQDHQARPAMVSVGAERWCVYLLASAIPAAQPHIAMEAEPHIGWAALRLSPLQKRCPAQR